MTEPVHDLAWAPGRIEVGCAGATEADEARQFLEAQLAGHALQAQLRFDLTATSTGAGLVLNCRLPAVVASYLAPGHNTLALSTHLASPMADHTTALRQEILLAMLLGPMMIRHPELAELTSALAIRSNIAQLAATTRMAFETSRAVRPSEFWRHDEEWGFLLKPGASLIEAMYRATQPGDGAAPFSFSCYRATEYVMLLGIAQEMAVCNPGLYAALQSLWRQRTISSGRFHDVFLQEVGSQAEPLPMHWYIPGDRVWFRNPDEASADVSGYEGSWVFYLGGGRFSNFWKRDQAYDLAGKCLEVYHWRHGTYQDAAGELRMDEDRVADHVSRSLADPAEAARIVARMSRYRDPRGVYAEGGCIDSTREWARWVGPRHGSVVLPAA